MNSFSGCIVRFIVLLILILPIGFNYLLFTENQAVAKDYNKYDSNIEVFNYNLDFEATRSLSSTLNKSAVLFSGIDLEMKQINVNYKKVAIKDQFKLNYHIENVNGSYKGSAYMGVYFSKDQILDNSDINVKYVNLDIDKKNISGNIYLNVPSIPEGDYYLLAKIDDQWGSSAINEVNENNNVSSLNKPMEIISNPNDIKAEITNVSADYNYLVVNYTLSNLTEYGVGAWDAKIYLSSDQLIDEEDRVVASLNKNEIETYIHPHSSLGLHINEVYLFPSEYLPSGDHYIIFEFNTSRSLPEVNFDNNIAISNKFSIDPYSLSLKIEEVKTNDEILSSDDKIPFTIYWKNDGSNDIDGLYFDLKTEVTQDGNSKEYLKQQWVWLAESESESIDVEIDMPSWISGGDAKVTFSSDYTNNFEKNISIIPAFLPATINLENLSQVYDGSEKEVSYNTNPAGLEVKVTYNKSNDLPIAAGKYDVFAEIEDSEYEGEANATLEITKATASIQFASNSVKYDGSPKQIEVITQPENLDYVITYNNQEDLPVDAGEYVVNVEITDENYQGTATTEFNILPKDVSVSFAGLEHTYDGETKSANISTTPEDLDFTIFYYDEDTIESTPNNAGSYLIKVVSNESNYVFTAWSTMTIYKADVQFTIASAPSDYDGSIKEAIVISNPSAVSNQVIYYDEDTIETEPVNAGEYLVKVISDDPNYEGEKWGLLIINALEASINTIPQTFTYDGNVPVINYDSDPAGLNINYEFFTADKIETEAIDVGEYLVKATINEQNYYGEAWESFTIEAVTIDFSFANTRTTYTGQELAVSVIPSLTGIDYEVSYWQEGMEVDPIDVGQYAVKVTAMDKSYQGSAETTFTIEPAQVEFLFANLEQEYSGNFINVSVSSNPANVTFSLQYYDLDTIATQPYERGEYLVKATSNDANYTGSAWEKLVITPTTAEIIFNELQHTFDGSTKQASVYTDPAGLNLKVKYNGSDELPIEAGIYEITASVDDKSFKGEEKAYLEIQKAKAEIFIGNLNFSNDTPTIEVSTMPAGLDYEVWYVNAGDTTDMVPVDPGAYTVIVDVLDPNYQASVSKAMVITGTDDELETILNVYPNPASDVISLGIFEDNMQVQILDFNGKIIKSWNLNHNQPLDISSINNGAYIVQVKTKQKQYTERLIIL